MPTYLTTILRAIAAWIAGWLQNLNLGIGDATETILSVLILIATIVWSILEKRRAAKKADDAPKPLTGPSK